MKKKTKTRATAKQTTGADIVFCDAGSEGVIREYRGAVLWVRGVPDFVLLRRLGLKPRLVPTYNGFNIPTDVTVIAARRWITVPKYVYCGQHCLHELSAVFNLEAKTVVCMDSVGRDIMAALRAEQCPWLKTIGFTLLT